MAEPYYQDDLVTLYLGGCEEILPTVGPVNIIVTSPPYNLGGSPWPHLGNWKQGDSPGGKSKWRNGSDGSGGVTYEDHDDTMPWGAYVDWQQRCLLLMWRQLAAGGAIFYNHKPRVIGARLWTPLELNPGLPLRQIIIWDRGSGLNFNPTAFVPQHEWLMVIAQEDFRLKSKGVSGMGDVWRLNADTGNAHPAPFPVRLPARVIEATGPGVVLDPFAGSGSTLIAAREAGVRSIGIEKSEAYCEMAVRRLNQGVLFGASA